MTNYILEFQTDKSPGMIRYVRFETDQSAWAYYDQKLRKDFHTYVKIYKLDGEVMR
jgi:hypothetical protein